MCTGVGGLNPEEAAKAMIAEVKKHPKKSMPLEKIVFIGFNENLTRAFEKTVNKILSEYSL
jgi:O-acetyl-ADP-ribose deacetylase (regulator of RNase III)